MELEMKSAVRYRELSRDRKGGVKIEVLCPECYDSYLAVVVLWRRKEVSKVSKGVD